MNTNRVTYKVKIWNVHSYTRNPRQGKKGGRSYRIRWKTDAKVHSQSFQTSGLADEFRGQLRAAARTGEPFDLESGLPLSLWPEHIRPEKTLYELVQDYMARRWKHISASHRKSVLETASTATLALIRETPGCPSDKAVRSALNKSWGFNYGRKNVEPSREVGAVLEWIRRNSPPAGVFDDYDTMYRVLDALATKLDGTVAAPNTYARRYNALCPILKYGIARGYISESHFNEIKLKDAMPSGEVDRRVVVSPPQARALLWAVGQPEISGPSGPRLVAFFALLYYAALRPEEALYLRKRNLDLPRHGWGQLHLEKAEPNPGSDYTDSGMPSEERSLKRRADGETRPVPSPPPLTALLHDHIQTFGTGPDGTLFVGHRGGRFSATTYGRVWARARAAVFTPELRASPLAGRPYDLRHAAVSTWLHAGVNAKQAADWAGHSVAVLLKTYAAVIAGKEKQARDQIDKALGHNTGIGQAPVR